MLGKAARVQIRGTLDMSSFRKIFNQSARSVKWPGVTPKIDFDFLL